MSIKVYLKAVTAMIIWGMSFLWSDKLIRLGISVEYFIFVRVALAGVLLLIINKALGFDLRVKRKDLWKFVGLAFCEPFLYFIFESYGIQFSESPTYSSLVIASTPIFSIIAGVILFREKMTKLNVLGVLVCLAGIVMVTLTATSVGAKFILGLILLLFAVFSDVGLALFAKTIGDGYKPQVVVMYQSLFGAVFFLPLFLTKGLNHFDASLYLSWEAISPILYLAVFCSVIAFTLWVGTINELGVAKSSVFIAMNPVVTALVGTAIGQEFLNPLQWVGIAVAVMGVIFSQIKAKERA